jgi:hypothetical protein
LAAENGADIDFSANVSADGSAGVQAVWVLYTGKPGSPYYGTWAPLDLTQDTNDPSMWNGTLPAFNGNADDILFMVQAVGGAGLTNLDTNNGAYYSVGLENQTPPPPPVATQLDIVAPPTSGVYSQSSAFTLQLTSASLPVADKTVTLYIGGQQTQATTDVNGEATISMEMSVTPGNYMVQAGFSGDPEYLSSTDSSAFTVNKESVTLTVTPSSASVAQNALTPFVATIKNSSGYPLVGKSVVFVVHNGTSTFARSATADYLGKARLGILPITAGVYTVDVYFNGTIPIGVSGSLTLSDAYYQNASLLNARTLTITGPPDTTGPTVSSITRVTASPSAKASVQFLVTFSEAVTSITTADFSLTQSGVTGASVSSVSGSGATRTVTVNSGSGNGTLRLDIPNTASITDLAGNALTTSLPFTGGQTYTINKTLIYKSTGPQDGWILESSETSKIGGTINATATTFRLGDDATNKQYRGILSFNTGTLPDAATVTSVTLKVRRQGVTGGGNPLSTFQGFMVDIKKGSFGTTALQTSDFQATFTAATGKTYGPFNPALSAGWYSINLSGGKAYINKLSTNSGLTQIRLRFKLDDNNNAVANYLSLFSGNAPMFSRPQLVITYTVP